MSERVNDLPAPAAALPEQPWVLYLLECAGGRLYAGITNDLAARFAAHGNGRGARFTRAFPPLRIVAAAMLPSRSAALKAEVLLKRQRRAAKPSFLAGCGVALAPDRLEACASVQSVPSGDDRGGVPRASDALQKTGDLPKYRRGAREAPATRTAQEMIPTPMTLTKFPPDAAAPPTGCGGCGTPESLGFAFSYAYQPIVDVQRRQVYGHEALVRGPDAEPAFTILSRVNEDNRYRFDQACRVKAIKVASQLGLRERLSINFLPNAIYKPELCIRTTLEAARAHDFPVERIIFEATEGDAIEDGPRLAAILTEYKRTGFLTAIDDFGAGYAGLNLLADFQPDLVKLDMALVRGVDSSRSRQAIARGVLRICAELDIEVIAEGVETAAERDFFVHEGVALMQGYLFGRPAFQSLAPIADAAWPSLAS